MKLDVLTLDGNIFVDMDDLAHWLASILLTGNDLDVDTVRRIRNEVLRVADENRIP